MGINQGPISLDQKYTQGTGHVFMTGIQALVRLPMAQIRRDRAAGLNTAGFISGYRGSPLGGYDQQLFAARKHLEQYNIKFQPGVNEDLAATAIWGSQQLALSPGAKYDGAVGIWYGKGPGVDRCGDVFRHGNAAGSAKHGGVLCLAGDDHGAKSSTVPHQSDHAFISALMPYLYPSSIHEMIEMGLLGIAMSRYSGCWVGMKVITETVETTAEIDLTDEMTPFIIPADFELPPGGLNIRWPDDRFEQDRRLQDYKGFAAIAFARANKVNRITMDSPNARYGIMASGKSYEDIRQALRELGITPEIAAKIGIRLYKIGMPWPLEPEGVRNFAVGLEEIFIVEERREIVENQVKQELFNWRDDVRPRIVGKMDDHDKRFLTFAAELSVASLASSLTERLLRLNLNPEIAEMLRAKADWFNGRQSSQMQATAPVSRTPYFCSGCPHNTSTKVPEGSRALGGIGCHFMALWMNRSTETFTHMGGEGVPWVGIAPFTNENHIFANLGDGTYFHSGILAIRQSIASKANITYKILYNDAVAMTGGQHHDGDLSPQKITFQLHAEGIREIYLVSENPGSYPADTIAPGVKLFHRDELENVQKMCRDTKGTSAIVFVQTCAAEKRRRRKRGLMEDPARRVLINPAVCEGCGDCSVQSNCISVEPLETELGRKRTINQSTCNKDYSCVKGFCPSFVTVDGGTLKRRAPTELGDIGALPEPASKPALDRPYNIAVGGVGGTGVLTIGALLGMAAHIEGKASMILDMSGLAQKGGAVLSHVRLSEHTADVTCSRIVTGTADLVLAADEVVAVSKDTISLCEASRTVGIINSHIIPTADFILNRDFNFQSRKVNSVLETELRKDSAFFDFTKPAEALLGDSIATNIMMMGFAYQRGLLPLSAESIQQAIEVNGVSIKMNTQAFQLGRLAAADPARLAAMMKGQDDVAPVKSLDAMSLDEIIIHRMDLLTGYQNARLAKRYRKLVDQVRETATKGGYGEALPRAVAINYAKLLAYKDEYEVARLFTDGRFEKQLRDQFEGDFKFNFNLAPPILGGGLDAQGRPKKRAFGSWMMSAFKVMARFRFLRGTPLDIFGYNADRKLERDLIAGYEKDVATVLNLLSPLNHDIAVELLSLPDRIRGYGPVKDKAIKEAKVRYAQLAADLANPPPAPRQMAAE
ncbi:MULTISPECIES: indolepyruvate ferredoxin oxidoreductase family protein [unclassified Bradyrhizobium]|uniref:indolepyruvate ferredoxin oxidoreductase family protein n=1 Tax=unclassified Bradyrhizobium TaxID=2631580 RepID=UPI001BA7D1DD|nr:MULTISPECIES: indolepyruvate ferredoxin oxidoreductase family protein [unclassified Bradyrhizobium]MBR1204675.1 indolepyruvate ferredoxin oxidoreductase family protein [Bradyrhizobium sp. AUGA SZCCT0124]MBR1309439.1 indolepyruvate ferredoxin oxidoreductase family protein [Bradyrhizobium sp. AUGA SZCCT0051]MBR1342314.1 indolepyruvate ferredoxin oxidoreductase family protein [Bradyrhizobium sp. AUGA SZCCT0105]MBR1354187.1 indolepyruvate ferredoxin oxidoreductase family protein [Bradyrhizobium 